MATLQDAIDEIQDQIGTLSGIRGAPDEAPEEINVFPFAVAYASDGTWNWNTPEDKVGLHNVVIELHVARKDLPRDISAAMAYSDSVPNAIFLARKDGTLSAIEIFESISYVFGPLNWGGVDTIGFRFTVNNIKMRSNIA